MSGEGGSVRRNDTLPTITASGTAEAPLPTAQGTLTVGPPVQVETRPFDPEPRRENIRAWLAGLLVAAFLFLTGGLVLAVVRGWVDMATAKDLATLTLTPLFGLTSTAVTPAGALSELAPARGLIGREAGRRVVDAATGFRRGRCRLARAPR